MEPNLRNFLKQLVQQAIQALLYTTAWRLPLWLALVLLAGLIGAAMHWHLY